MSNIFLSVFTIIFSLFFLIESFNLPASRSAGTLGPAAWPTVLLSLMLIFGICLLINSIISFLKDKKAQESGFTEANGELIKSETIIESEEMEGEIVFPYRYLFIFGTIFVYLILLSFIGFVLSTPLLIIAIAMFLGMRKIPQILSTSIIGSAALVYVFILVLNIPLPRGVGFFRDLSILLY